MSSSFLKNITSFAVSDLGKTGQTLADYGLADPAYTVEFTSGKKSFKLLVGDDTKTATASMSFRPTAPASMSSAGSLAESVGLSLADLRASSIFTIPVFESAPSTSRPPHLQPQGPPPAAMRALAGISRAPSRPAPPRPPSKPTITRSTRSRRKLSRPAIRASIESAWPPPCSVSPSSGNARRETLLLGTP